MKDVIRDMEGCHQETKRWAVGRRATTPKKPDKNHRAEF